jgi:hypothetical protein
MPRTRYPRKRLGYRNYVASLWQLLAPFMEPSSLDQGGPDVSGLRADGLSAEQIETLMGLLAELGDQFRAGLGIARLPSDPPDFFAIGALMPAWGFSGSSRLRGHLKAKGRPRKIATRPLRPEQATVDTWMLGRAAVAFGQGELALKEASIVMECMAAVGASRTQARVAFSRVPREFRRQRGQHDRWAPHRALDPSA